MKKKQLSGMIGFILIPLFFLSATGRENGNSLFNNTFDLSIEKVQEKQYFIMESWLKNFSADGSLQGTDIFALQLKYEPNVNDPSQKGHYTCVNFSISYGDTKKISIPALKNWNYVFNDSSEGRQNYVFGIDHSRFENLQDSEGRALSFDKSYHVYNAFIDFHAFCNVFADPVGMDNGIEDLKQIGQKIIHAAANTQAPTNLGSHIAEGSYFKNGKITLELKGVSKFNDKTCALIGFDSGESSFKMIMHPVPQMEVITTGRSRYRGDIYKDTESGWVQKVVFNEAVISETVLPVPPNQIHSVTERDIVITNVSRETFNRFK